MNGEVLFPSEKRIDAIGQNGGDGGHYDNYITLRNVLDRAFEQASSGKGQARHGQNLPFDKQPMQQIQDLVGEGFALGQAIKKMQESQRLSHDAAIRELLAVSNYIVGVILFVIVAHSTVSVAVSACVLPFIPTAIIKAVLACVLGLNIRKRIPGVKKA